MLTLHSLDGGSTWISVLLQIPCRKSSLGIRDHQTPQAPVLVGQVVPLSIPYNPKDYLSDF
jgi:hypothetical protein